MFLMSKINLLTKDIYCLEIQFAAAILAQTETSEWLFLYFAGQRLLSVQAFTPACCISAAPPSAQFPELDWR